MAINGIRRLLVGERLPTARAIHERLNKFLALPVFGSDAISSSAYAVEEVLLGLVLTLRRPLFPFARIRLVQERALVLGAAAAAAQTGSDLRVALRAAAELTAAPSVRADACAVAASLERGAPTAGLVLFGELGSALFAAAAGQGAGVETLAALADFEEATVAGEWKGQLLKAEVLSLATGGLALCSAGALHFTIYSSAFVM